MRRLLTILLSLVALFGATAASAQSYRFTVDKLEMTATIAPDASVHVAYNIVFENRPGAHEIDIVDIGLPAEGASRREMKAIIDGHPVTDIRESEYVHPGVEVHLGANAIAAGETGRFQFEFTQPDLVFEDVTSQDLASFRITPTWFGDEYVVGTTDIEIAVIVPGDVTPDEVVWQQGAFDEKAVVDGGVAVLFSLPQVRLTSSHLVGVSFPRRVMKRVVEQSAWELAVKWFVERPGLRMAWGAGLLLVGAFVFFRFSGRTGCVVFGLLAVALVGLFSVFPGVQLIAPLPLGLLLVFNERALRRRQGSYLPPIAEMEGGGIKRGLTAAEAAVLLELPFGKVLQLVLVGLLKKGVLRLDPADPTRVVPGDGYQDCVRDHEALLAEAAGRDVVLAQHEARFASVAVGPGPLSEKDFTKVVKALILHVSTRMKGFDLSDTQDYYRQVISRALKEVEGLPEPSARERAADESLEWLLMNDVGFAALSRPGLGYRPMWFPVPVRLGGSTGSSMSSSSSASSPSGRTSLSDVASGFAGWTENTASGLAATLTPASLGIKGVGEGGFMDLSGVDRATGSILKAMASSSGGGGGRSSGGGCACACAGCACACACAGGGR